VQSSRFWVLSRSIEKASSIERLFLWDKLNYILKLLMGLIAWFTISSLNAPLKKWANPVLPWVAIQSICICFIRVIDDFSIFRVIKCVSCNFVLETAYKILHNVLQHHYLEAIWGIYHQSNLTCQIKLANSTSFGTVLSHLKIGSKYKFQ
jgi:hypothetical protein